MAAALGALAALALVSSAAASDPWVRLYRPLHLPAMAPGDPCPVSPVARFNFARYGVGKGIGPGPVYPIGFFQPGSLLRFPYPPAPARIFGTEWAATKVLWFVAPRYRGPVLIRGRKLDAPVEVRFERGMLPFEELRIARGARGGHPPGYRLVGQRYRPSYTRLREGGCYAYQIDGTTSAGRSYSAPKLSRNRASRARPSQRVRVASMDPNAFQGVVLPRRARPAARNRAADGRRPSSRRRRRPAGEAGAGARRRRSAPRRGPG